MCEVLMRRSGAVLVVAVCQLIFSKPTAADSDTVARFRKEYPEAGRHIEEVYSHIAIGTRCRYFDAGTFRMENMFHFIRDGLRLRLTQEMLTTHNNPYSTQYAYLINDSHYFTVRRKDLASPSVLQSAFPLSGPRPRGLTLCFESMEPPPLNLYGFHLASDWSHTFFTMFEWEGGIRKSETIPPHQAHPGSLVDAETIHEGEKELIKIYVKTRYVLPAEFTLSPNGHWIVVAYRFPFSPSVVFSGRHEFEGTYRQVPLIKSAEYLFQLHLPEINVPGDSSIKSEVMFIDPERKFEDAVFEPEAIGIRFSPPIPTSEAYFPGQKSPLMWPVYLLAASIVVLLVSYYLTLQRCLTKTVVSDIP